jgi:hypothetical protein
MAIQGESSASLALPPSNRSELHEQATEDVLEAARQYARQRARLVRRAGVRVDHLYARELVQDAYADTWAGTDVQWDPAQCSLLEHLRGLIRSRTWKDATGARQRPHVSIDWDEDLVTEVDDAHRHGTQGNVSPIVLARVAATVVQDLQRLAAGDAAATAILAAWEDGLVDRDEVIARTALTDKEYKAARARLTYLVLSLPQSLRETARTVLRGKS